LSDPFRFFTGVKTAQPSKGENLTLESSKIRFALPKNDGLLRTASDIFLQVFALSILSFSRKRLSVGTSTPVD
jgi:hypothetical protein